MQIYRITSIDGININTVAYIKKNLGVSAIAEVTKHADPGYLELDEQPTFKGVTPTILHCGFHTDFPADPCMSHLSSHSGCAGSSAMRASSKDNPNASAIPLPYVGSAMKQLQMCLCLMKISESAIAREVFSQVAF